MTVTELEDRMPNHEFQAWVAYTGYTAQQRELAERKAKRASRG